MSGNPTTEAITPVSAFSAGNVAQSVEDGKWWRFLLWLARHGWWRHTGPCGFEPSHWPRGRVIYPDGARSVPMALGNACDYAEIFGGKVVKP